MGLILWSLMMTTILEESQNDRKWNCISEGDRKSIVNLIFIFQQDELELCLQVLAAQIG